MCVSRLLIMVMRQSVWVEPIYFYYMNRIGRIDGQQATKLIPGGFRLWFLLNSLISC